MNDNTLKLVKILTITSQFTNTINMITSGVPENVTQYLLQASPHAIGYHIKAHSYTNNSSKQNKKIAFHALTNPFDRYHHTMTTMKTITHCL